MKIAEILTQAKPILFNTEMVRAILDGRKTQTRRVLKPQPEITGKLGLYHWKCYWDMIGESEVSSKLRNSPLARYTIGDILYVRETWRKNNGKYFYKADQCADYDDYKFGVARYHPSIHMPKEAARIFFRVTGVKVERLQDITAAECVREGIPKESLIEVGEDFTIGQFSDLWDSTIKKKDLSLYGWEANPWVWVYEFERIEANENG